MIRSIIFDWSGTLVDDLPAVWQATNVVLRRAGVPELTLDQFRAEFCLPFQQFYDRFTPHVPLGQLESWFHEAFRQLQPSVVELPHARRFLEFCRQQGLRCFVLSTVRAEYFVAQTARNGFGEFFERVWLEVWDKRQQIQPLLAEAGLDPAETLLVGDMEHDIETARHGGLWACAVLTGYNTRHQLRATEPDFIVEHLEELRQLLARRATSAAPPSGTPGPAALSVAGLVVNSDGQVLLVRKSQGNDTWDLPTGRIQRGETPVQALRRQVKQATNLELSHVEFVFVPEDLGWADPQPDAPGLSLTYLCRCTDHRPVNLGSPTTELCWVPLRQAAVLPLNPAAHRLLEAAVQRGLVALATPSQPLV